MATAETTNDLVEAQVICAGVSYFTVDNVMNARGEQMTVNGQPVISTTRHEALMGQTIHVTQYEFDRLEGLGAVRKPSSDPIGPTRPTATPFSGPVRNSEGELEDYMGPVMGDPSPIAREGMSDVEFREGVNSGALTPEQAAEMERAAREGTNPADSTAAIQERDYDAANKSALEAEASRRGLTVEGTGSGGSVLKDDLVAALEADDEA